MNNTDKTTSSTKSHYIKGQEKVRSLSNDFTMNVSLSRLHLREFTLDDRQALVSMHRNARVRSLLIDDQPFEQPYFSHAFLIRQQEIYRDFPGLGIWCAERMVIALDQADLLRPEIKSFPTELVEKLSTPQPKFAGWFNLMPIPDQLDEVELGSRLLPENWGTGLAMDGGEYLLEHAFMKLNCDRLWIVSHKEHHSVNYIAHALGFQKDEVRKYCDAEAQYYCLYKKHWELWRRLPRRQKIKCGVNACRKHQSLHNLGESAL